MLTISKRARYGLRAMLYLAQQEQLTSAKEISEAEDIPYQFLEQIIADLRQEGLIKSKRGAHGGYLLTKPSHQISMGEIVKPLEERISLAGCLGVNSEHCKRQQYCLAKKGWEQLQQTLVNTMDSTSLANLLNQ